MSAVRNSLQTLLITGYFLAFTLFVPNVASAELILDVQPASVLGNPGTTVTFTGRITNLTGVTLNATDLFLDFSGFDPDILTVNQLLGDPDFVLPDHTFSALVNLFSVTFAAAALPGAYPLDVFLQDVNGNLSDTVTVNAIVNGPAVPEPGTLLLVFSGLVCAGILGPVPRRAYS